MEENILDILGLQLVDYFINFENYQPYNLSEKDKLHTKGKVYLVNKQSNNLQIIKITKQTNFNPNEIKNFHDSVINDISKELKNNNLKILNIILNNEGQNEVHNSPTVKTIVATPGKTIIELSKVFPNIIKIIKTDFSQDDENEKNDEDENISAREKKWKKINFQNRHFLKDALTKSTNSHLTITWLFFALPIVTYFITYFIATSNGVLSGVSNSDILVLFFGGSYHNLVIGANQYWRWLTYPFVQFNSIALIFSLFMFYRLGRYIEGFYGVWKSLIIWVGAIVLTAIVQNTIDIYNILSGFTILSLICIGAMIPIIWNYKLFKSPLMIKLVTSFIWLFFYWILLDNQVITWLYWMIGIATGWIMGAVVSYHNRKLTVFYAFSPIAIGLLILFFILLYFLNPYKNYDDNTYTMQTLGCYNQLGLCGTGFINWVQNTFFG